MANDPKALLSNGQINKLHVNPSLYVELGAVTLALALVMLGAAWFRKRLFLGIAMALYGLSIFNLHYWGFGFPFILVGAWYLVRAYRLSEKLKQAKADAARRRRPRLGRAAARSPEALHPSGGPDPAGAQAQAGQGARSRLTGVRAHGPRTGARASSPTAHQRGVVSAPARCRFAGPYQGLCISSHVGNTDVTVPKSPRCIVCGGKPNCPSCPWRTSCSQCDGAGLP